MPFGVEDLARTALVRILPRSRYRLAAQNDARFQSFASSSSRIAYRQQGATPALLIFSGPGQNPYAAAMAAATWAEANWRPNAIQRRVRPGVVVVHVAPGNQLTPAGPVNGAAVPATVWTVDSATGRVDTSGNPPGSPPASTIRSSATALMRGAPAPSLGELDAAERGVMQLRTIGMSPLLGYVVRALVFIFALRYGLGGLVGLMALPSLLHERAVNLVTLTVGVSILLLVGVVFGAALVFNVRNMALSVPGFSSPSAGVRNLAWGGYVAAMIALAVVYDGVIPSFERHTPASSGQPNYRAVTVTVDDDGSGTYVEVGGVLTVDLSAWPSSEWSGVQFKTSNPSVLAVAATPSPGDHPVARFNALKTGAARVDAASADGRYSFQVTVSVATSGGP